MPKKFPSDAQYVWAKQAETGHERPITEAMYDFAPDAWELMPDRPAADSGGNPLPAKYKTTVTEAAKKKASSGPQSNTEGA